MATMEAFERPATSPLPFVSSDIRTEGRPIVRCERCDAETDHFIQYVGPDNDIHYVCWDCVQREEKHITIRPGWRRMRREPADGR